MICNLCPRKCNAIRNEKEGKGFCGLSDNPKVARIAPHLWEEPPISGSKGSGAVFFSGCTLRCVFCQNYEISAENRGTIITPEKLADEFKELEEIGVHNINLVSPTPYVNLIKNALDIYKPSVPILYNSSGYERTSTIDSLKGYVDIYLPDFKYSDNELANNYSKAPNYTEITTNAIIEMTKQVGENEYDDNGIMKKGVIIRHLVLPNHTKNSIGVLDIINDKFKNTPVSLMGQYVPVHKAFEYGKLNRRITTREYNKVKNHMIELGLNGFTQELSSADEAFIPDWDYK
jgi:putative pyruvate formate lyase activating enzyme